jgi:hypothetical protein
LMGKRRCSFIVLSQTVVLTFGIKGIIQKTKIDTKKFTLMHTRYKTGHKLIKKTKKCI